MSGLDRHSQYFSPRRYQKLRQDTEGEYASVGLVLGPGSFDARPPRSSPGPTSTTSSTARRPRRPASRSTTGSPRSTANRPPPAARRSSRPARWEARLRGAIGTRVKLGVWRAGWPGPREPLAGPRPDQDPVGQGRPGRARHRLQSRSAASRRRPAATSPPPSASSTSSGNLKVLVLDLRDDPGGLLDQAVKVADDFLSDGLIVTIRGPRTARPEEHVAHQPGTWPGFPIYCLVDGGSASRPPRSSRAPSRTAAGRPSSARAATARDRFRTFFDLADGAGLKLTTARYYTPRRADHWKAPESHRISRSASSRHRGRGRRRCAPAPPPASDRRRALGWRSHPQRVQESLDGCLMIHSSHEPSKKLAAPWGPSREPAAFPARSFDSINLRRVGL